MKNVRALWLYVGGYIPLATKQRIRRALLPIRLGVVRGTKPISDRGWGRGTPIDRPYIERFLQKHADEIRGRVLEVKDSGYTRRFGTGVSTSDVLDIDAANPRATIVGDLSQPLGLPADVFDCLIITQTLQYVPDLPAAISSLYRMLKPGGVALVTVPCIAQVEPWLPVADRWRLTPASSHEIFSAVFGSENTTVEGYGNVLAAVGFLTGLAAEELPEPELHTSSPEFTMIVAIRAHKSA